MISFQIFQLSKNLPLQSKTQIATLNDDTVLTTIRLNKFKEVTRHTHEMSTYRDAGPLILFHSIATHNTCNTAYYISAAMMHHSFGYVTKCCRNETPKKIDAHDIMDVLY
jgi:hypothetical protein